MSHVTDQRLQKSFFIAEVWSIEERLRRLSPAEFVAWKHGPWSIHVRQGAEAAVESGSITTTVKAAKRRPEAEFLEGAPNWKPRLLSKEDLEFLDMTLLQIRYLDNDRLTAVSKASPPFVRTPYGESIDLDGYLRALNEKHAKLQNSDRIARLVAEAKAG